MRDRMTKGDRMMGLAAFLCWNREYRLVVVLPLPLSGGASRLRCWFLFDEARR